MSAPPIHGLQLQVFGIRIICDQVFPSAQTNFTGRSSVISAWQHSHWLLGSMESRRKLLDKRVQKKDPFQHQLIWYLSREWF